MSELIGPHNIREHLTAFADGELDAAQTLAVLDYLAAHPEGMDLLRTQQRLRRAAERVIRDGTPPVPDGLRRRVEALAVAASAGAYDHPSAAARPPQRTGRRWFALAATAAALLAAGVFAGRWLLPGPGPTREPVVTAQPLPGGVPAGIASHLMRGHSDCSRLAEALHTAGYPQEMAALATAVRAEAGGADPFPDLTDIGYNFVGVGPCEEPLAGTVHLLYRRTLPNGHPRTISVFVQPFTGQFQMRPGTLYSLSTAASPFPMQAWRTAAVIYFLIADNDAAAASARQSIAVAPRP